MHLKAYKVYATMVFSFFILLQLRWPQLSPNYHRFVILCICWDTPRDEKTGLWQLPKVSMWLSSNAVRCHLMFTPSKRNLKHDVGGINSTKRASINKGIFRQSKDERQSRPLKIVQTKQNRLNKISTPKVHIVTRCSVFYVNFEGRQMQWHFQCTFSYKLGNFSL